MKQKLLSAALALALCLGLAVPAMAAGDTFTDVPAGHWAHDDIEAMAALEVVKGVGGGRFAPDDKVACADFSTMVARLLFPVELGRHGEDSPWWKAGADVLLEAGALDNTTAKAFYIRAMYSWDKAVMEQPMRRYDMAQVMYNTLNALKFEMPSGSELRAAREAIADYADIPSDYKDAVTAMYAIGCLRGMDEAGNFRGEEKMDRAQACAVLARMLARYDEQTPDLDIGDFPTESTMEVGDIDVFEFGNFHERAWFELETSNPGVVSIPVEGAVLAVAPGRATVTLTVHLGGKSQTFPIAITVVEGAGSQTADPGSDLQALRQDMLTLINRQREAAGAGPLALDDKLCQAAQVRAQELVRSYAHTRPDGRTCYTAMDEAGVSYRSAGENIAAGYPSVDQVMDGWMNSEGHRANILNTKYSRVGIGFYYSNGGYQTYWVQMFAN